MTLVGFGGAVWSVDHAGAPGMKHEGSRECRTFGKHRRACEFSIRPRRQISIRAVSRDSDVISIRYHMKYGFMHSTEQEYSSGQRVLRAASDPEDDSETAGSTPWEIEGRLRW